METLKGSTHPATLLKKCVVCNFILKNQLHLATNEDGPFWYLFCPNLSCSRFGDPQIMYTIVRDSKEIVVDSSLIPVDRPDTTIESD